MTKIRVGQVWFNKDSGVQHKIIRVIDKHVYTDATESDGTIYKNLSYGKASLEQYFTLDGDWKLLNGSGVLSFKRKQ